MARPTLQIFAALSGALFAADGADAQGALHAPDSQSGDAFGYSVAATAETLVVGALREDAKGLDAGAAYVYVDGPAGWTAPRKLVPGGALAAGALFGYDAAVDGDVVVVGAPGTFGAGVPGFVQVFERLEGSWSPVRRLATSAEQLDDLYGRSVSVSGDTLVVGAARDDDAGYDAGAVYVYERGVDGWALTQKLTPAGLGPFDYFGHAVDVAGERLAVSAYADDDAGVNAGAVYVFRRDAAGLFEVEAKLSGSATTHHDNFGSSIALDGADLVVGVPSADLRGGTSGEAYVFDAERGWAETARLAPVDLAVGHAFGISVAVEDGRIAVGASNAGDLGANSGAVYGFKRQAERWVGLGKQLAEDGSSYDYFGLHVDLSAGRAVVGAFGAEAASVGGGAVYTLGLEDAEYHAFCDTYAPCGNLDDDAGCANSTGAGALLEIAGGSLRATADDLELAVSSLPASSSVYLLVGTPAEPQLFKSGFLAVARKGVRALRVSDADGDGRIDFGAGLGAQLTDIYGAKAALLPGDTLAFQVSYRDRWSPCSWKQNTSNALAITFAP